MGVSALPTRQTDVRRRGTLIGVTEQLVPTQPAAAEPAGQEWSARLLARHSQPALDALRGLAALAIVVTHVAFQTGVSTHGLAGAVTARLDVGVAIFFVLSGYLLTAPHVAAADAGRGAPSARRYLWHRVLRILPAYWVACVAAILLVPANHGLPVATVVRNLLLLQVYRPNELLADFTQTWSLCTEVLFYVLLPLLAVLLVRSLRRGRLTSAAILLLAMVAVNLAYLIVFRTTSLIDPGVGSLLLPAYLSWFAAGMGLAIIRRASAASRFKAWVDAAAAAPLACWTIAAATLLLATTSVAGPKAFESVPTASQEITKNLLYLVVAVALMIPLAFGEPQTRLRRHLSATPWRLLGEVSYGVFLWHLMVSQWAVRVRGDHVFGGDFWPVLALTVVGSLAVATASLVVIERPFLRLRDRGRRQPAPSVGGASGAASPAEGSTEGGTTATAASETATAIWTQPQSPA